MYIYLSVYLSYLSISIHMQTPEKTKGLVRAVMQTSFSVNI